MGRKPVKPGKRDPGLRTTALVHGEEEAKKAQEGARALFSAGNAANMPSTTLAAEDFQDGAIDLISLLCKAGW